MYKTIKENFIIFYKDTDILSQWYKCEFKDEKNILYNSAEQYMMAKKALLFEDTNTYQSIMIEKKLSTIKKLGREVKGFNSDIWNKYKEDIVYKANHFKFFQNRELGSYLTSTGSKIIVESNPNDFIWSCGLKPNDENIYDKSKWKGQNLLGEILMQVREVCFEDEYRNMNDFLFARRD